jgi:4'-phosphopantetheinyl transferase
MPEQHRGSQPPARCVQRFGLDLPGRPEVSAFRLAYRFEAEPDAETLDLLTENERERMARFRFVEDRVRFAGTRATLRALLGAELDLAPGLVPLELGHNGKPMLGPELGVHFNVSHSGSEGLIALSRSFALGVDVELKRPDIEFRSVAARVFSAAELEELEGLEEAAARERFYRGWTYKEAVLKALGLGIASDTRCFAVLERRQLGVSAEPSALPVAADRLRVAALPAASGYAAAIALVL